MTLPFNNSEIMDIDGNIYHTINIGNQSWFVENLRATRFQNGDLINNYPLSSVKPSYYIPAIDATLGSKYGYLYNREVIYDNRKVCPDGWHIPTENDWNILIEFLGGREIAGLEMKDSGSEYWNSGNSNATNEHGFTAIPVGKYSFTFHRHYNLGRECYWWVYNSAWIINLDGGDGIHFISYHDGDLHSIRCIQDL